MANVLANRYNKSYDPPPTSATRFPIRPTRSSRDLKQDATITYFDQTSRFPQAKDLLDRYANLSPKVHVKYVDPETIRKWPAPPTYAITAQRSCRSAPKKEEAKGITEEGITGALIRDLKGSTRTVCFVAGSGEHQIDDTDRDGFSDFKDLLAKDNYATKAISLLQKAEVPADCTVLVVGGPVSDYVQPEVDAIKKYVEGGGRALFMLDPPLKIGQIADRRQQHARLRCSRAGASPRTRI